MPIYFFWVYHKQTVSRYMKNPHSLRTKVRKELYALCIALMNKICHTLHSVLIYHLKRNYTPWQIYRQYLYTWVWRV
nr:protein E16C [Elephantid betaherpesvirus 1]